MLQTLYQSQLVAVAHEAPNTDTFLFTKPDNFDYKAGQYIRLILHNKKGVRDSRYFTLSSSPNDALLCVTVKIKPSPYRQKLYNLKKGDKIEFYGPMGVLCIDSTVKGDYIFLSGGIGITPFMSMMAYAFQTNMQVRIKLFASFHEQDDLPRGFYEGLRMFAIERPTLETNITVTKGAGHLQFDTIKKAIEGMNVKLFCLCGSEEFVKDREEMLLKNGVSPQRILKELFI